MAQTGHRPNSAKNDADGGYTLIHLVMLTCYVVSIEGSTLLGAIYCFTTLQYLGVPTSLASFNGVVGGTSAILMIPFFGVITDRGSNPKKRKTVAMPLSASFLLASYVFLLTALLLKRDDDRIADSMTVLGFGNQTRFGQTNDSTHSNTISMEANGTITPIHPPKELVTESSQGSITIPAVLGLIAYSLLDLGFDFGNSVARAFALEFTPPSRHNAVLNVASFVAPISGAIVSCIGIVNFSDILGAAFHVDGTTATLVAFLIFLTVLLFLTVSCSVLSGHRLAKKNVIIKNGDNVDDSKDPNIKSYNDNRLSFSLRHKVDFEISRQFPVASFISSFSKREDGYKTSNSIKGNELEEEKRLLLDDGLPNLLSQVENGPNERVFASNDIGAPDQKTPLLQGRASKPSFFTKKLIVLLLSVFLAMVCMQAFINSVSISVAVGIYRGDPRASVGSTARNLYDDGMRKVALGYTVFYCSYFIFSTVSKKVLSIMGNRMLFLSSLVLHLLVNAVYIWIQHEGLFFTAMVTFGIFRWAIYTIPYMMANDFTNESMNCGNVEEEEAESNATKAGRVISVVGILSPLTYLLNSILMGPSIGTTGNVWLPMTYGCCSSLVSVFLFIPLFFLK